MFDKLPCFYVPTYNIQYTILYEYTNIDNRLCYDEKKKIQSIK